MSKQPEFVQPAPFGVDLEPGKDYWFCSCGKSKNQPFCDGSHKGSGMAPIKFNVEEKKKYWLCGCKLSDSLPFCDGTHRKEKGIKKYNEFLLQKNTELKADVERTKKGMLATFTIAVIAISAHMLWLTRKS